MQVELKCWFDHPGIDENVCVNLVVVGKDDGRFEKTFQPT